MSRRTHLVAGALLCISLVSATDLSADDWPAYRHDMARSGVTSETLGTPLHRQWVYAAAPAPRPAWPEPGRELNRLAFDYAYDVAVVRSVVYFGSSADHKVRALDLSTGQPRWSFFTDGPIRFAPAVEEGRVFVASDDGWLYCLSAADGRVLWRFSGAPGPEKLMGNGQMISRWPLRSGVAVGNGVVYFSAGMWPSEGVYTYALRAEDGEVVWENSTSGLNYLKQPHPGSFSMTGVAPQGYMLADGERLFVPTGRNVPAAYDRGTGKLLYYRSQPTNWGNRWGGSWCFLADGLLFNWRCHLGPDIDVLPGEFAPDKNDGLVAFDAATGKEKREFPGKLDAVIGGDTLYATGSGEVTAYDLKAWVGGAKASACTRWATDHGRAYALILAGDTLVAGGQGTVTAFAASNGEVLWQDKVGGQVRSLAVADGRLLASTTEGHIVCYGPDELANPPTISSTVGRVPAGVEPPDSAGVSMARSIVEQTGKRTGHCLVLGAGDGRLLVHLVEESELDIVCVEPDADRVASARQVLEAAGLYGIRVTVHVGSLGALAYPDYFADVILFGDGTSRDLKRCRARELYRVLRPCGGVACIAPAAPRSAIGAASRWLGRAASLGAVGPFPASTIVRWLERGGVPKDEIKVSESLVQVVRGKLPGSDDWTHQYATAGRTGASNDQRVRLPLKLLWFGEPGPAPLVTRHWAGPAPLCVNGRMFVIGQHSLIAVDAYNGRQLWRRDFPTAAWWPIRAKGSSAAADDDSVYLVQDKTCLRLDAATGETLQTYSLPPPPASLPADKTKSIRWSYLAVESGRILGTMGSGTEGCCVFVLGKDGKLLWTYSPTGTVNGNSLAMDGGRVYLIEQTSPADVARAKRRGEKIAEKGQLLALDAAAGKVVWKTEEAIAGRAELWLSEGVLVATSRSGMTGYDAATGEPLYARQVAMARFPVIVGGAIYAEPAAYDLHTGEPNERVSPFTGEKVPWNFQRSYGCGSIAGGPGLLLFRSGALGMYDLAGDSGVHNFGGVRAGCYVNAIVASGLVLCPPADAACTCSYSLRTTVALMPAEERPDDWAIFYDQLPTTSVHRVALNLGAIGDRRDPDGNIWLAAPRPETRSRRPGFAEPFRFAFHKGFGPYRHSAERSPIARTDQPWIYTSGLKGLQRAEIDLDILDRGLVAWPTDAPPTLDGRDADPCWDGYRTFPIAGEQASVTARHDRDNLYIACRRPPALDKDGHVRPWRKTVGTADSEVWKDDSFELFLSNMPRQPQSPSDRCLHLAVSASGARHDAMWTYASPFPTLDIPKLDITVDGKTDDWGEDGLRVLSLTAPQGKMRTPENFDPSFRIGWDDEGLLLLAQVADDAVVEAADPSRLWEGDSIELFMTPKLGSNDAFQLAFSPGADPKHPSPRSRFYDQRRAARGKPLTARIAGQKTERGYVAELLLPWSDLGIRPTEGLEFGVQLFANDKDKGGEAPFRVIWHPGGHPFSNRNPSAYQVFRLAKAPSQPVEFKRGAERDKAGLLAAVPPYPFPITVPPLGAKGEDPAYTGEWTSAVRADDEAFVAELAIPWKTLAAAGLDRKNLMLDVVARGPLRQPPVAGRGYERLILVPGGMARPRTVSVRLHFAETEGAGRGERVFDVKLQGRTVLKNFDIRRAAWGSNRAIVKQFDGIVATRALVLELIPKAKGLTPATAPTLSAIEVLPAPEE